MSSPMQPTPSTAPTLSAGADPWRRPPPRVPIYASPASSSGEVHTSGLAQVSPSFYTKPRSNPVSFRSVMSPARTGVKFPTSFGHTTIALMDYQGSIVAESTEFSEVVRYLQSQIDSLRNRVEELEIQNAKLSSLVSNCSCHKMEDNVNATTVDSIHEDVVEEMSRLQLERNDGMRSEILTSPQTRSRKLFVSNSTNFVSETNILSPSDSSFVSKRKVPSGRNQIEPPPSLTFVDKRKVPTGSNPEQPPLNPNFDTKRLVPTGPNPKQSPESPPNLNFGTKRLVPTGPNPEQSPESPPNLNFGVKRPNPEQSPPNWNFGTKRLVPSGPNPEQFPGSPPNLNFGTKILVPTGPNPEQSPESPPNLNFGTRRLVPTGPNLEQSPESPPNLNFGFKRPNPEQSPPNWNFGTNRLVPSGPNPEQSPGSPLNLNFGTKRSVRSVRTQKTPRQFRYQKSR